MATATVDYRVHNIRHENVTPDPDQPRKTFAEEGLMALAASIKSEGLLQPITVRPSKGYSRRNQHSEYVIVAGERRWRACGMLGWATIPALVKDLDEQAIVKAQLLENAVRTDLNPVEEATALKRALDEGVPIHELANAMGGWTVRAIQWRIDMLKARDEVLHAVARGQMTAYVGWHIGQLSNNGQMRVLRAMQLNNLGIKQTHALCDRINAEESQADMFPETILSEEQVRAVRTFSDAFENVSAVLNRIETMHEKNPQALIQAFAAESTVLNAKIAAAIKGLKRVQGMLVQNEVNELEV